MKLIPILLLLAFNIKAMASGLNQEELITIVEKIAKSERRNLWTQGHQSVDSEVELMSAGSLTDYQSLNNTYETSLGSDEEEELFNCIKNKECELYLITLSSEYYSGYGVDSVFVQINTTNGTYNDQIKHSIYSE